MSLINKGLFQVFGIINKNQNSFNTKGVGFGLTISQKLVQKLGGQINMESKEDLGTVVSFTVKENSNI